MPLLSTRASLASAGYGQNLSPTRPDVFTGYGNSPFVPAYTNFDYLISPDGTALYLAQFYDNVSLSTRTWYITVYSRNTSTGQLTFVSTTEVVTLGTSSSFYLTISPSSNHLYVTIANNPTSTTDSTNVVFQYSINSVTKQILPLVPSYVDVGVGTGVYNAKLSQDGKFLYIGSFAVNKIFIYSRNTTTGLLTYSNVYNTPANTLPWCPIVSTDNAFLYASSWGTTNLSNGILQYSRNTITGNITALVPEGVTTSGNTGYFNLTPNGTSVHVGCDGGTTYNFVRNTGTGLLTLGSTQSLALERAAFSSDSSRLFAVVGAIPDEYMTQQSRYNADIDPTTKALSAYNTEFVGIDSNSATLIAAPTYNYYYSVHSNYIVQWNISGGYLTPVEFSSPSGAKLNYYTGSSWPYFSYPSFVCLSHNGYNLYTNGYWPYPDFGGLTAKGTQFVINTGTKVPTKRSDSNSTGGAQQEGTGGIVITPDDKFLYIVDSFNNPPVIRQYSRNLSTGILTALGTPTINLPTSSSYNPSFDKSQYGYPIISNDGKHLYVSYRSFDNAVSVVPYIIQYSINTTTGQLTLIGTVNIGTRAASYNLVNSQKVGYELVIHPNDNFVFSQCLTTTGVDLVTFSRNTTTGVLTLISNTNISGNPYYGPSFLCMSPDGNNIYASLYEAVASLSVNSTTGETTLQKYQYGQYYAAAARLVMLPDGTGVIGYQNPSGTVNDGFFFLQRNTTTGNLSNVPSKPFDFNSPATSISPYFGTANGIAVSSDSAHVYVTSKYLCFGTITA